MKGNIKAVQNIWLAFLKLLSCTRPLSVFECVQAVHVHPLLFLLLFPFFFIASCNLTFPFLITTSPSFLFHSLSLLSLPQSCCSVPLFPPSLLPFTSPPHEYQHFIIQQGFTGTLWNHLFHGSLIECDTSHTSNGRSSDSFSLSLSAWASLSPPFLSTFVSVSCFCLFTLTSRSTVKTQQSYNTKTDVYNAAQSPHWVITSVIQKQGRITVS